MYCVDVLHWLFLSSPIGRMGGNPEGSCRVPDGIDVSRRSFPDIRKRLIGALTYPNSAARIDFPDSLHASYSALIL